MAHRIAMIGAGSFFTDSITEGFCRQQELFAGSTFVLMDADERRLRLSEARNRQIVEDAGADIRIEATTDYEVPEYGRADEVVEPSDVHAEGTGDESDEGDHNDEEGSE